MPDALTKEQVNTIRFSNELSSSVAYYLADPWLAARPFDDLSDDNYAGWYNACLDTLNNEVPIVAEITGKGSYGCFPITVRGIPGIYFVRAQEFSDEGPFTSLDEAVGWAQFNYQTFIDAANEAEQDDQNPALYEATDPIREQIDGMTPLCIARVQDLEPDDVVTVACSACGDSQTYSHRGLWQGIQLLHSSPNAKIVDLVWPKCCPKCNAEGTAVVTIRQAKPGDGGGRPSPDGC